MLLMCERACVCVSESKCTDPASKLTSDNDRYECALYTRVNSDEYLIHLITILARAPLK